MKTKTTPLLIFVTTLAVGTATLTSFSRQGKAATVPLPTPKPLAQAVQDLKRNPPLDPTKLGDPMPRNLFVELSKLINPAVVSITTTQGVRQSQGQFRDPLQQFMEEFYGGRGMPGMQPQQREPLQALGTGFIIRADGLIITNNHVVEQADIIKVQLEQSSKQVFEAEVVGRDARTDIALIKIDAKRPLPVAQLGSSKDIQVGEWVAAFGNPYGHAHTMTKGIISAIGRELNEINKFPFIQTDASINPGNSGGPLVNTYGQVIGVNTAIDARAQGIGFAIPIDNVKDIIAVLEKDGRVRRGYIGVSIASINEEVAASLGLKDIEGVVVTQILRGSPALAANMKPYDIITDFAGKKVTDANSLQDAVSDIKIGDSAKVKILRFDERGKRTDLSLNVKVVESPDDARKSAKQTKRYFGQQAPFDLGFKISDLTPELIHEFNLQEGMPAAPVVTDITPNSAAAQSGMQAGDLVLDINRQSMAHATDVLKTLKKGRNTVRIMRGNMVAILPLGK